MISDTLDIAPASAAARIRRFAPSLRLVAVVGWFLMTVGAGQILLGASQIGVSNDERVHQARMLTWFETGWYLPMRFIDESTGSPAPEFGNRIHTYGAGYSIVAHGFNVVTGAEEPGQPNREARAYVGRSLVVGALGIVTVGALLFAMTVMTGSWTVGVWTGAALVAVPAWVGYSMFAIKDIPAAAGWTMLTAGLVVALAPGHHWRRPIAVACLCVCGIWFSFGVRTALWVVVVTSLVAFAVLATFSLDRPRLRRNVVGVIVGAVTGFAGVSTLHYQNAATPWQWLIGSVRSARDFHWTGATLTAGRLVTENPPWWYLPSWVLGSLPLLLGSLALAGAGLLAVSLLRRSATGDVRGRIGQRQAASVLWAHQALLLPIAATVTNSTMYGGLRQHLYALPALAALAGSAVWWLVQKYRRGWLARGLSVLLIGSLVAPVVEHTRLFPYNYTYKNVLAGPVNDRWEADMHWTSRREALRRVPGGVDAYYYTEATQMLSGDIRTRRLRVVPSRGIGPFVGEQGTEASRPGDDGRIWVIARRYRGSPPNPGCVEYDNVTRPLRGEQVIMSYVLLCDSDMAPDR